MMSREGNTRFYCQFPGCLLRLVDLSDFPAAVTDEQLSNLVSIQAETEIPFSAESAIFDYHNIRRGENGVSVDLIAAKRESVAEIHQLSETDWRCADANHSVSDGNCDIGTASPWRGHAGADNDNCRYRRREHRSLFVSRAET